MLQMMTLESRYCPMLFCDWCGGKLTEHGNCLWQVAADMDGSALVETVNLRGENRSAHIFLVHKDCDQAFCEANGGRDVWGYSEELPVFLVFLLDNSGIEWSLARKWADMGK